MSLLLICSPKDISQRRLPYTDPNTLATAAEIVNDVRQRGEEAVREHAERLGDLQPGQPLVIPRHELDRQLAKLPSTQQELLQRVADRIGNFARMQRGCLKEGSLVENGITAGHHVSPVQRAGCYAPGGRFPLPSSVLMTAVTAKAAGVEQVWVASPRPSAAPLAAAAVAGADGLLGVGGAQAIAALAYGAGAVPACDLVVGPGNVFVTAAKRLVAGDVGIDFLAGPSELVVLADEQAEPALVAADLLAQAEHDDDALPVLVTTHQPLIEAVNEELERQLDDLPTADTARNALKNGYAVLCPGMQEARDVCNDLAPEHLALHVVNPEITSTGLTNYGGLFLGQGAAEVLGDYGAGPNHVLPTGGAARYTGGLSVLTFLRVRTWMQCQGLRPSTALAQDAADLARLEGLEAHARSAERRR